ncbi:MAG: collagen binding domain-containing protein, partial [Clostridium sp.]
MNIKFKSKIISLLIIFNLMINLTFPVYAAEVTNNKIDTINSVVVKDKDGNLIESNNEYPLEQGSKVSLSYKWSIDNNNRPKSGDYTEVQVPKAFSIFNSVEGDLVVEGGNTAGRFYLDLDGKLKLVYNDYVETHKNISGTVSFRSEFNKYVIKGENPVKVIIPISETKSSELVIKFKPNNILNLVEKKGMPDKSVNPNKINWTIDFNKGLNYIKEGILTDKIGEGQELDINSLEIYELKVDLEGKATLGNIIDKSKYTITTLDRGFSVNLGSISSAYRIVYNTNITDKSKSSYDNLATFQGEDAKAQVNIGRGKLIKKNGIPNISYDSKYIDWLIDINTTESEIPSAVVSDEIGKGLSLDNTSIKVYKTELDSKGNIVKETLLSESEYKLEINEKGFKVDLGSINTPYRIKYKTNIEDIEKNQGTGFVNTAKLENLDSVTVNVNPDISNIYKKVPLGKINYKNKTMGWRITIDPLKNPIETLEIEDTFENGGLRLIEESIVVMSGKNKLIKDIDYTVTLRTPGDLSTGFIISFKNKLHSNLYTIDYKTSFNPDEHKNDKSKNNYINKAVFKVNGIDNIIKNAQQSISNSAVNNGYKVGKLDPDKKYITFEVYTNYLEKTQNNITVKDNLEGNHTLVKDSISVFNYKINEDGKIILGNRVDPTNYTITSISDKEFAIDINGPTDKAYVITYKTQRTGVAQEIYYNKAVVNDKTYVGNVKYTDFNKVVNKTGTQIGEKIKWTISANTNLSEVENANLVDTLSSGQELDKKSFKVYSALDKKPYTDYSLEFKEKDPGTGSQTFKLKFLSKINDEYIIEYESKITTAKDKDKITNVVYFEGNGITTENTPFESVIEVRVTDGEGSGGGSTTDPDKPVDPDKPGDPDKPVDPDKPGEDVKPGDPDKPVDPDKPGEDVKPGDPD